MKSPSVFSLASFSIQLVLWTGFSTIGIAESVKCLPVSNISTGKMMICWKQSIVEPVHVLIHFHGSNDTLKAAYERTELNAVLVVVNFPGLSSAYSAPFHDDPLLFQAILKRARDSFYNSASFEKEKEGTPAIGGEYPCLRLVPVMVRSARYSSRRQTFIELTISLPLIPSMLV